MVVSTLFVVASNSTAYTRSVEFNNTYTMEIHAIHIGSGSYKGKVGVDSITINSPYYEILYYTGCTIVDRNSSYVGFSTKPYRINSTTAFVHFSAESRASNSFTATLCWEYDC